MPYHLLKQYFGFDHFRPGQEDVITRVLAGKSAAAIFPTGSGKSLCYQLPALQLPGLTLVVSPLLALMKDQLDFLTSKQIPAARLDSSLGRDAYNQVLSDARSGLLKILMVSVERFKNERFRRLLPALGVRLLVVDEAHCISEWGHNFRPDYLKLPAIQKAFNIPQSLLLTATATPDVASDMTKKFGIASEDIVSTGFFRPNLTLNVSPAAPDKKPEALLQLLGNNPPGPVVVYVTQQKTSDDVAGWLKKNGWAAEAYHAGLKPDVRTDIQNRFMSGEVSVVVATIAFGMGIDKGNIRKIIHLDLPKSIENYSQEIGRAGRDGQPAVCTVLGNKDNISVLENYVYGDTPEKSGIETVLRDIQEASGGVWEVRLFQLSRQSDIRQLPLKTLLVYLEMAGVIRPKHTYFEDYPFKLIQSAKEIWEQFDGQRQDFVRALFSHSTTAKVWSRIDMDAVCRQTGSDRLRIVRALEYFDEKGWIFLSAKTAVDVYDIQDDAFDPAEMAELLYRRFQDKEGAEIKRISGMTELLASATCLPASLSGYFGEPVPACGMCSACNGMPAVFSRNIKALPDAGLILDYVSSLIVEGEKPMSARSITRFLCGISSPELTRRKAGRLAGFGVFSNHRFSDVLRLVEKGGFSSPSY